MDSYRQCQPQQQRVSNEALAAIREALDLYRVLAAQKSAAFTPNLVTSTRVVADLHAGTPEVALGEWDTSIAAVPAPFRALVAVAATDWVHEQDDAARAQSFTATAIQAAEVDEQVNASTRQAIRRAIRGKLGDWKSTPVWSDWVTRHIPDPVLQLANAWAGAGADSTAFAEVLRRHESLLVEILLIRLRHPIADTPTIAIGDRHPHREHFHSHGTHLLAPGILLQALRILRYPGTNLVLF